MQFERTEEYESKLFELALCDEKHIIKDADIQIVRFGGKLKAYCVQSDTYLQFPRALRGPFAEFVADVVQVIRTDDVTPYYRAMKGSIRKQGSNEVLG